MIEATITMVAASIHYFRKSLNFEMSDYFCIFAYKH